MRIRTNYKDMSFVDDVSGEQARDYFVEYYEVAMNFFHCFNGFKNDLISLVR